MTMRQCRPDEGLLDYFDERADGGTLDGDVEAAFVALDVQKSQKPSMTESDWARRKHALPHVYLDDVYGTLLECEEDNATRLLGGEDHRALLELWDCMESRGGEGVIYLPFGPNDGKEI